MIWGLPATAVTVFPVLWQGFYENWGRTTGMLGMISWPPLSKCFWSSDSLDSVSGSQALCVFLWCLRIYMNVALSLCTASFSVLVHSVNLPFMPCPILHILTLTRKTFLVMLTQRLGQYLPLSSAFVPAPTPPPAGWSGYNCCSSFPRMVTT